MSLTISPLILLNPICLDCSKYAPMDLIQVSSPDQKHVTAMTNFSKVLMELGNNKPEMVQRLEEVMWPMLYAIAKGTRSVIAGLNELMVQIPWSIINGWHDDDPERCWFCPRELM